MAITEQYTGSRGALGIGVESVFGTAVSPTDYVRFVSETLEEDPGWVPEQSISNTRQKNTTLVGGPSGTGGTIVYNFGPTNAMLLLAAAFGKAPAPTGGTDPYTHTFDTNDDGLPSLTIVKTLARGTSFHMFVKYVGCLVSKWNLKAAVGSAAQVTADIMGQRGIVDVATGVSTPTVPSDQPFTLKDLAVSFGSGHTQDATARNLEIDINNNAVADHTFVAGGQQYPSLIYAGDREITGTVAIALATGSDTHYTDAMTGVSGVLRALFAVNGLSPARSVQLDLLNLIWGKPSQPLVQGQRIVQTLPWTAYLPSGAANDLQAKVINGKSAAYIP